jgi:hypothetical protein
MLSSPYDKRSKRGLNLSNSGPAKDVEREEAERHEVPLGRMAGDSRGLYGRPLIYLQWAIALWFLRRKT